MVLFVRLINTNKFISYFCLTAFYVLSQEDPRPPLTGHPPYSMAHLPDWYLLVFHRQPLELTTTSTPSRNSTTATEAMNQHRYLNFNIKSIEHSATGSRAGVKSRCVRMNLPVVWRQNPNNVQST